MADSHEPGADPVKLQADNPEHLYNILDATEGRLVLDGHANFHGKRPFYRVYNDEVQRAIVYDDGDEYRVESELINKQTFLQTIAQCDVLHLWPIHDSPFTAVENEEEDDDLHF